MLYNYNVIFYLKSGKVFGCLMSFNTDEAVIKYIYKDTIFTIPYSETKKKRKFISITVSEISHLEITLKK